MKKSKKLIFILALFMTITGPLATRVLAEEEGTDTGVNQELNIDEDKKDTNEEVKKSELTLEELDSMDKKLRENRVYLIATDSEIKTYEDALAALKSALDQGREANTEELRANLEKAKGDLGYTTYKGLHLRSKIREDLVHLSKIDTNEDYTSLKDEADKAVANHNTSIDVLRSLSDRLDAILTNEDLGELTDEDLRDLEVKRGYPDDLLNFNNGNMDKEESFLIARVFLEEVPSIKESERYAALSAKDKQALDLKIGEVKDAYDAKSDYVMDVLNEAYKLSDSILKKNKANEKATADPSKDDQKEDPSKEEDQTKEDEEFDKASKELAKKIDEATSDKISTDSLDKLKLDYKAKLSDLLVAEGVKLEDLKNLEKEFDLKLNPRVNVNMSQTEVSDSKEDGKDQAEKKEDKQQESNKENKNKTIQKKKLVKVDKKKDNNTKDTKLKKGKGQSKDVKTGVRRILPVVGTVAVVAVVVLIFLSRKNKNK
ncbi:hypothetical protein [Anaerococcus sp. AGMB09787]|uniref:hypothetical protein n=1 Tax=Anaerococcus sp. AGMB09787 TaxID=2922869 RepID=UPI001FAF962A|nr:hypothetical protein [Anaerococcus sp. AGMB09787]